MNTETPKPGSTVTGPLFPEPVQVIVCVPIGLSVKLIGKGLDSGQVYEPILDESQLATLKVSPDQPPFEADPVQFRLGVEALGLALAYEYDPYFSLSFARVDPLPHQLEAVYDYFIKLPRIRFLLADDPGALLTGKGDWPIMFKSESDKARIPATRVPLIVREPTCHAFLTT